MSTCSRIRICVGVMLLALLALALLGFGAAPLGAQLSQVETARDLPPADVEPSASAPASPCRAQAGCAGAYPLPPSLPASVKRMTLGADQAIWFTMAGTGVGLIGRIAPDGTIMTYTVSSGVPEGITAGSDGAVWYTHGSYIGRITAAGVISEFVLPTAGEERWQAGEITAGPDGALWFTASGLDGCPGIGRITITGTVSISGGYASCFDDFKYITAGPSGDAGIWFTGRQYIGRIGLDGSGVTFFPVEGDYGGLHGLTAGPQGALWFFAGKDLMRMTVNGEISDTIGLYREHCANDMYPEDTAQITVGPDNALWVVRPNLDRVCRFLPGEDQFTFYTISETLPVSNLQDITVGADGALWYGGDQMIGRLAAEGTLSEFGLPIVNSHPRNVSPYGEGIGFTADGHLGMAASCSTPSQDDTDPDDPYDNWSGPAMPGETFSSQDRANGGGGYSQFGTGSRLQQMQATAVITRVHILPTPYSDPRGIAVDPEDGTVWLTEFATNKIARITASTVLTEYTIPTPDSQPQDITLDPDTGAVWFTEFAGNKIGRITLEGVLTEYAIPTANSQPHDITLGPDGALWFTEFAGNKIGRLTPAGVFSEFSVPTSNSGPAGITAGPDGAIWFTEALGNKVGRITLKGGVTERPLLTPNSYPLGITTGADGNIWFALYNANKIGQIIVPLDAPLDEYFVFLPLVSK